MQIEIMPTAKLVPYIRNARTHSADQVAQISASIAEFGSTNPIPIGEDGVIIAGHGSSSLTAAVDLVGVAKIRPYLHSQRPRDRRKAVTRAGSKWEMLTA